MGPVELVREALRSLQAHRLRSALTLLGVVIGIASVVLMLAVGEGVRRQVESELGLLGRDLLLVTPAETPRPGQARADVAATLTSADARAIATQPGVAAAAAMVQGNAWLVSGSRASAAMLVGATPEVFEVRRWALAEGVAFGDREQRGVARSIVLGRALAARLFPHGPAVGGSVRIGSHSFVVAGVLAASGRTFDSAADLGELAVVPLSTARLLLLPPRYPDEVQLIIVQAGSAAATAAARASIEDTLRARHRLGADRADDFRIEDLAQLAQAGRAVANSLAMLLGAIGAVSLLVGGIGIMNIMLVSVTERRREIGVRMALGAGRSTLLAQFLAEAVVLCVIGAALGALLAQAAAWALGSIGPLPVRLDATALAVAVLFGIGVGVVFGLHPALRATRLEPMQCLRAE